MTECKHYRISVDVHHEDMYSVSLVKCHGGYEKTREKHKGGDHYVQYIQCDDCGENLDHDEIQTTIPRFDELVGL